MIQYTVCEFLYIYIFFFHGVMTGGLFFFFHFPTSIYLPHFFFFFKYMCAYKEIENISLFSHMSVGDNLTVSG